MTKVWSWSEQDYVGDDDEPEAYPIDVCAEACDVCGLPHTVTNPVLFLCDVCSNATHGACGADTEPSGGYDRDPDENDWVCFVCLRACEPVEAGNVTDPIPLESLALPDDFDPFHELYALP